MKQVDENWKLASLRNELWLRGLIQKKWMLNYIRKAEAVHLLNNFRSEEEIPKSYITMIKQRCSVHKKKVYRAKKDRSAGISAELTRDEKYKKVINSADKLVFTEVVQHDSNFMSYFGSTKGKLAFVFRDSTGLTYQFTRTEVERLVSMGLYIPRGVLSNSRTKISKPAKSTKTLKDVFSDGT